MASDSNNQGWWKPWKDGKLENTIKALGIVTAFLFVSGLCGAGYDPVLSNPYVWGVYTRATFLNITGR